MKNPFIPSQSKVCRVADTVLVFSVVVFALVACTASVIVQIAGACQ